MLPSVIPGYSQQIVSDNPNHGARNDRSHPVEKAGNIPCSPVEPAPPGHVGALATSELSDPAILGLGVLTGDKPHAAYRAASSPHVRCKTQKTLQRNSGDRVA